MWSTNALAQFATVAMQGRSLHGTSAGFSDCVRIAIAVIRHFLTGGPGGPSSAAVAAC